MLSTNLIVVLSVTSVWFFASFIVPFFIWGRIQMMLRVSIVMTAACVYLSWISLYCFQLNPLVGPQMNPKQILELIPIWRSHSVVT